MPLQDLTPQLRTRLNRMERAVGWFILIATLLLLVGLGYYIYKTAEARGWFKIKAQYYIYTERGDGLKIGNDVNLMGFVVGHILEITPMPPTWGKKSSNNVYVRFEVEEPNFGYIWTDSSKVQIKSSSFLGARGLDISKGMDGYATYITNPFRDDMTLAELKTLDHPEYWRLGQELREGTNVILPPWKPLTNNLDKLGELLGTNQFCVISTNGRKRNITAVWNESRRTYEKFNKTNIYGLPRLEEQDVADRLNAMAAQVQAALPNILDLTNKLNNALGNLNTTLANASQLTSNFNTIAVSAKPAVTNLAAITEHLRDPNGSLGQWVLPPSLNQKLDTTVDNVNGAITTLNTNLLTLNKTLENLANMTGNLDQQVGRNTNLVTDVDKIVIHSDEMVQGLKHFWLFRRQFDTHTGKPKHRYTNAPVVAPKQKQ